MNTWNDRLTRNAARWLLFAAVATVALLGHAAARAQTAPATTVVTATRDATVDSSAIDENFGAEKTLLVAATPGASEQRGAAEDAQEIQRGVFHGHWLLFASGLRG